MMVQDILIMLTTVLFVVLVLLVGSLWFSEDDWKNRR